MFMMREVAGPLVVPTGREATLGERATVHMSDDTFVAILNGHRFGVLSLDIYDKSCGDDCRHVHNVAVIAKQQGIGTRLYDAAEAYLTSQGLRLVPSPGNVLSKEAWEFWRRRAPELLVNNPYKYDPQYLGRRVRHRDAEWEIQRVGSGARHFNGKREDNVTAILPGPVVHATLGAPDEDAATLYLFERAPARPHGPAATGLNMSR